MAKPLSPFIDQCVVDPARLTPAQSEWLSTLLDRAGLPHVAEISDGE